MDKYETCKYGVDLQRGEFYVDTPNNVLNTYLKQTSYEQIDSLARRGVNALSVETGHNRHKFTIHTARPAAIDPQQAVQTYGRIVSFVNGLSAATTYRLQRDPRLHMSMEGTSPYRTIRGTTKIDTKYLEQSGEFVISSLATEYMQRLARNMRLGTPEAIALNVGAMVHKRFVQFQTDESEPGYAEARVTRTGKTGDETNIRLDAKRLIDPRQQLVLLGGMIAIANAQDLLQPSSQSVTMAE